MSFIYTVDALIRTVPAGEIETENNICIVAKSKLNGELREALIGCPDTWAAMRGIIVATAVNRKTVPALTAELNALQQGNMTLDTYYNKIKGLMIDIILKQTGGLAHAEAVAIETARKNEARTQFIDGMENGLSMYVLDKNPATLEDAYAIAAERCEKTEQNSTMSELIKALQQLSQKNHPSEQNGEASGQAIFCIFHNTDTHNTDECRALKVKRMNRNNYHDDFNYDQNDQQNSYPEQGEWDQEYEPNEVENFEQENLNCDQNQYQ